MKLYSIQSGLKAARTTMQANPHMLARFEAIFVASIGPKEIYQRHLYDQVIESVGTEVGVYFDPSLIPYTVEFRDQKGLILLSLIQTGNVFKYFQLLTAPQFGYIETWETNAASNESK